MPRGAPTSCAKQTTSSASRSSPAPPPPAETCRWSQAFPPTWPHGGSFGMGGWDLRPMRARTKELTEAVDHGPQVLWLGSQTCLAAQVLCHFTNCSQKTFKTQGISLVRAWSCHVFRISRWSGHGPVVSCETHIARAVRSPSLVSDWARLCIGGLPEILFGLLPGRLSAAGQDWRGV